MHFVDLPVLFSFLSLVSLLGVARVVDSLEQSVSVQKGDILITLYTNPSWTPLFSLVAGVILEEGGILSHSAVVARECGIPCVVQVKQARTRIRDGQKVSVNGDTGEVTILE